jgi:hypothetical protein
MLPAMTPKPRTDVEHREHLAGNVDAAGRHSLATGADPGHWQLHHTALLPGPGDFTPYQAPDYAEEIHSPLGNWLEQLAELLGPDHAQAIAQRGMEAGQ